MRPTQSLARRIVAAFVLMTAAVAGVFAVSVIQVLETVEMELVAGSMNRQLDSIIAGQDAGMSPHLGPDLALHVLPAGEGAAAPGWLAGLPPGLHEEVREDEAYHVMVREVGERRYILVLDQRDFERREHTLHRIVSAGFVFCVLAAGVLGVGLSRTVIAPVRRLSRQVRKWEQLQPGAPALAPGYADDEVGKLAIAFDRALARLRDALEREQLFTSDVSHELRTPLMVIASSCELLLAQGLPEAQRPQVARIARSAAEMQELVETFLRLARAPDSSAANAETTLAMVAEEQLRRWQPEAAARGLALDKVVEAADAGRYPAPQLRTVLSNLLRNALHYTDRGFVRLVLRSGGFSVVDSGVGIPETEQARVFKPFARGDESRGDGIGIGLSLVQRICKQQGWTVRLAERDSGGCEFRVDFGTG